jgi:thymidylate synthase (FAD)
MSVRLVSISPDAEGLILECARVSSNSTAKNTGTKLLSYLIQHKHWSPFEMANMVIEIETTRDISRQILRHRSFSFQEFSQRYQVIASDPVIRDTRLQDTKNRQNSIATEDDRLRADWEEMQEATWELAHGNYEKALEAGIAKEQARALLPEGMTRTKMFVNGTIRSWIHYLQLRRENGTQLEHQDLALKIMEVFRQQLPTIYESAFLNKPL